MSQPSKTFFPWSLHGSDSPAHPPRQRSPLRWVHRSAVLCHSIFDINRENMTPLRFFRLCVTIILDEFDGFNFEKVYIFPATTSKNRLAFLEKGGQKKGPTSFFLYGFFRLSGTFFFRYVEFLLFKFMCSEIGTRRSFLCTRTRFSNSLLHTLYALAWIFWPFRPTSSRLSGQEWRIARLAHQTVPSSPQNEKGCNIIKLC